MGLSHEESRAHSDDAWGGDLSIGDGVTGDDGEVFGSLRRILVPRPATRVRRLSIRMGTSSFI